MANIIDSLSIELGLDISKFKKSQQDVLDGLKQIEDANDDVSNSEIDNINKVTGAKKKASEEDKKISAEKKKSAEEEKKSGEASTKRSKETQLNNKKTADSFSSAKDSISSFGTALAGVVGLSAIQGFVSGMTNTNSALSRNSQLLNYSVNELSAWGSVLEKTGGNAEDFVSSMQSIKSGMAQFRIEGTGPVATALSKLGPSAMGAFNLREGTVDLIKFADALKAFKTAQGVTGEQDALKLASDLSISKSLYLTLIKGGEATQELLDKASKLNPISDENARSAQRLNDAWVDVANALTGNKNIIMSELNPDLMKLADVTKESILEFREWNQENKGLVTTIIELVAAITAFSTAIKVLKLLGVPSIFKFLAKYPKLTGFLGMTLYSKGLNEGEDEDLAKEQKKAGITPTPNLPRNLRNNNPGNIEYGSFAKEAGATGTDGRFAIFPDMETGKKAQIKLLKNYVSKGNNTISKIVRKWNPVSGENSEKNVSSYEQAWANKMGISKDTPLTESDITENFRAAQERQEGFTTFQKTKNIPISIPAPIKGEESYWSKFAKLTDPKGFFDANRASDYLSQHSQMVGANATTPLNKTSNVSSTQNNNIIVNSNSANPKAVAREIPSAIEANTLKMNGMVSGN